MTFYFKAEANFKIGGGHLSRCIAIAKECILQGHQVAFLFSDSSDESIDRITQQNWTHHIIAPDEALNPAAYLTIIPEGSFILFDTDDANYYAGKLIDSLREKKIITACYTITDQFEITTDILVNTNIISETHKYRTPTYTQQILGPRYLIFSEQFRGTVIPEKVARTTNNLLLFFGNADLHQLTQKVVLALEKGPALFSHVHVVIGALNPQHKEIIQSVDAVNYPITIHHNLANISSLYEQTDMALTAAGMSMWEMALYNIPQLVIASSDREMTYAPYMSRKKLIHLLGAYSQVNTGKELYDEVAKFSQNTPEKKLELNTFKSLLDPNGVELMVDKFVRYSKK